jgi:hypothetical protein
MAGGENPATVEKVLSSLLNIFFQRWIANCGLANLRFADPIIFCGLKTSANPQIHNFSPYKCKFKLLSFKFKDDLDISLPKIYLLDLG